MLRFTRLISQLTPPSGIGVGLAVYFSTVVSLAAAVDIWLLQLDSKSKKIPPGDSYLRPNGF